MPNYVQSVLTITGPERVIATLIEFVRDGEKVFAFEKIVPPPACVFRGDLGAIEEVANPGRNWYAWNTRRWGTKWGACNPSVSKRETCGPDTPSLVEFRYESAWAQAEPVIDELATLFPECSIRHAFIDEHGSGGCNGVSVYAPSSDGDRWGGDDASERRKTTRGDFEALHVEVFGKTSDAYFAEGEGEEEAANGS